MEDMEHLIEEFQLPPKLHDALEELSQQQLDISLALCRLSK